MASLRRGSLIPWLLLFVLSFARAQEYFNVSDWSDLAVDSNTDDAQANTTTMLSQETPPTGFIIGKRGSPVEKDLNTMGTWLAGIYCIHDLGKLKWNDTLEETFACTRSAKVSIRFKSYRSQMLVKHAVWAVAGAVVCFEFHMKKYLETEFWIKLDDVIIGEFGVFVEGGGMGVENDDGERSSIGNSTASSLASAGPVRNESSVEDVAALKGRDNSTLTLPGEVDVIPLLDQTPKRALCKDFFSMYYMFMCAMAVFAEPPGDARIERGFSRYHTREDFSFTMHQAVGRGSWSNGFKAWMAMEAVELITDWQSHDVDLPYKGWAFHGNVIEDVFLVGKFGFFKGPEDALSEKSDGPGVGGNQAAANVTFS